MAIDIKDSNITKNDVGVFNLANKDHVLVRKQNGSKAQMSYEDLLAQLTADIAVVGGGASFREIYKYDILLSL